jgi:class 3 adenylate cyclase/tetratricopeptide (TPR) repeat protein
MAVCPNCGEENPDKAKFCLECATPVKAPPPPPAEERKVVSVLFVDLVGFTARFHDADPEDVRAALAPYHQRLKTEIERFGGTVEKFIGDAVMAVFGAPVVHEDDAERAVRAALRIVGAIEELNESQPLLDLSIRAAVNTGEAVVSLGARPSIGEGLGTGDVVNTASRLQAASPVGGVIVGEITYRSTKGSISYEELDAVRVKGKPKPVRVWRAISARSRYGVEMEITPTTPFVGREFELELLKSTFRRTVRESSIQLVTILGEPGAGKTRLLSELASYLDAQDLLSSWRQGRSLPYGEGITFWALGEIVKTQAGILDSDSPDEASVKLQLAVEAVVEEPSERDWFSARLGPLIGVSGPADADSSREESFTAWRRFLEAVGRRSPLVVVFEDVHWADLPLLEFIDHLVEWSSGSPLLVLCSARPELFEKHPEWGGGKANSTTISLSPLTDAETAQLIGALLSTTLLPANVQEALLQRAGGNPLFASEFILMLRDRGFLTTDGRSLTIAADEIPIPETIHACIAARLDTLPSERKALLHHAAVVGKVFWTGAVAHVGELEEGALKYSLHELARRELIRPALKSSVNGEDEYSFRHALIADVSYNQIPRAARGRKHRSCAEWIESIAGDRVGDQAEVLAHHYGRAGELLGASARPDEREALQVSARGYLVMAGDRALHLDAGRARHFYERALELVPTADVARAGVVACLAKAAHIAGDLTVASELYEEAIPRLLAQGQGLEAGELLVWQGFAAWTKGQPASVSFHARAIEVLEAEPPSVELAYAYAYQAGADVSGGRPHEGLTWARKALELAKRIGARHAIPDALGFRGLARFATGDATGIEDLRRSVRLGLELGLGHGTGLSYVNLIWVTRLLEGPSAAKAVAEDALAFTLRRGLRDLEMGVRINLAEIFYESGRWDELLSVTDEILTWARAQQAGQTEVPALMMRIKVLVARGTIDDASALTSKQLSHARQLRDPQVLLPSLVTAAVVHQAGGFTEKAIRLLWEVEPLLRTNPDIGSWELPDAVRASVAAGGADVARALIEAVTVQGPHQEPPVRTAEAVVCEATGRVKEALALYAEVRESWKRRGSVVEEALALLGEGRCLLALGATEEGVERLRGARETFVGLGARPSIGELDELIGRAAVLGS